MKILIVLVAAGLLTSQLAAQQNRAAAALEAAKQKAMVTGDLNRAIKDYRELAERYVKSDRAVAAVALVLMAQAYEAQGSAEARRVYARVVKEYPNEKEAVTVARTRLNASDPAKGPSVRTLWIDGVVPTDGRLSPDGRFFTYTQNRNLFLYEIATGLSRNLTNLPNDGRDRAFESVFSSDGRQVAFLFGRQPDGRFDVRVVNVSGEPRPRVVFDDPALRDMYVNDWSRDGRFLAVELHPDDRTQLAVVAIADGSARVLKTVNGGIRGRAVQRMYFSRDGNYVAYDLRRNDSERHIFLLPVDGGPEVAVITRPGDNALVGWSPDGQWLLFRSDRTGTFDLWAIAIANGKPHGEPQRLKANLGGNFNAFGWTPGGALYYWTSTNTRPAASVHVAFVDFAGRGFVATPVALTRGHHENTSAPVWSPDGTRVAYLSGLRDRQAGRNDALIVRSITAGAVREIPLPSLTYVFDYGATWTPDGRDVIVVAADLNNVSGLYRVNTETGDVSPVTKTANPLQMSELTWMQGAGVLLAEGPTPSGHSIFQVNVQTGAATVLVSAEVRNGVRYPRPSPDGRTVYYRRQLVNEEPAFVARDLASGSEREVIRRQALQSLHLSPDGRYIAAAAIDAGSNSRVILLIPTGGGEPRELVRVPSGVKPEELGRMNLGQIVSVLAWNADSRSVVVRKYIRNADQDELAVVSIDGQESGTIKVPRTLPQNVRLSPDNRQVAYTVQEAALPAVREVFALENFLPKAGAPK